jgi:hypothetical protein
MRRFDKAKAAALGSIALLIAVSAFMGFVAGYYEGTGFLPSLQQQDDMSVLPPVDTPAMTTTEIAGSVAEIPDRDYGEGYNCVDFAWATMRHLHWQGQMAGIVRLVLDPGPDHAVIMVATDDDGWIFLEPQNGQRINPRVGGKWASGQTITGMHAMAIEWVPLDQYASDDLWHATNDTSGIGDVVYWPVDDEEAEEYAELSTYVTQSFIQLPLVVVMLGLALWKKGWVRTVLSLCIVIWGAYYAGIDMKMAAPMIAAGMILFFSSVLTPGMANE